MDVSRRYILARGFVVRGRMVGNGGNHAYDPIRLEGMNSNAVAAAGPDGTFTVALPDGAYTPMASLQEIRSDPETGMPSDISVTMPVSSPVVISIEGPNTLTFTRPSLPPLGTLTGRIAADGFTPTEITIRMWLEEGGFHHGRSEVRYGLFSVLCPAGEIGIIDIGGKTGAETFARHRVSLPGPELRAGERRRHDIALPHYERLDLEMTPPAGLRVQSIALRTSGGDERHLPYYDDVAHVKDQLTIPRKEDHLRCLIIVDHPLLWTFLPVRQDGSSGSYLAQEG